MSLLWGTSEVLVRFKFMSEFNLRGFRENLNFFSAEFEDLNSIFVIIRKQSFSVWYGTVISTPDNT
jgi:hypothetical protein